MTENKPPEKSAGDAAAAIARAGLSAVPLVGGPMVELLNNLIVPPLERRREQWMRDVGESLSRLESERGVPIESLRDNPVFIDTLIQAGYAAVRTHQVEKHDALRAAVLNAALPEPPDEAVQQMFLAWVAELTTWHLRILRLFHNPPGWMEEAGRGLRGGGSSLEDVLLSAYPDLRGKRPLYDQVWADLNQRGLIATDSLHGMMTNNGTLSRRTSELGADFLAFITAPKAK